MKYMKWKWVAKGLFFGVLFVTAITFATMLLWNNLAVTLFALPTLSFFQALGLMILGRLLTGGFRPGGWRGGRHMGGHHLRERWQKMSPEQREKIMQRWGKWSQTDENQSAAV